MSIIIVIFVVYHF